MELIYKNVSSLMDVSFFIISTYDKNEESVDVKFCVKEGEIVPLSFRTYLSNPESVMTAFTIKNKKEIIINDWEKEYTLFQKDAWQLKDKNDLYCDSMIWIPLLIKDKVVGLFTVQSTKKNAYSKYDIEMLRSLSSIIAVALNNAEAYHKIDTANTEITAQKNIVEEKQKEILDSIEYALRIQTAILPPQKIVKQHLENSFILYKPKDIVAGDFYWMETVQLDNVPMKQLDNVPIEKFENEKQFDSEGYRNLKMKKDESNFQIGKSSNSQIILFAACDCTGHGVPGAMVSVVCHNALNRAVHEFGLTTPAAILDKTAEIVVENFAKSEEEIKDGMDISLCALNFNKVSNIVKVELQWAGANNPLWLIRNSEFEETKADKQPIGMNEDHHPFTNHTFNLEKGDTIYIFSDGFADQFSPADKKLMKKNFKNVLIGIQDKTMQDQQAYLNSFIENWKGNMEQTDDILVIGVRV
jgi:serine phosphatase RsbU (regulator of sigma subunit)